MDEPMDLPGYHPEEALNIDKTKIHEAVKLIMGAKRPLILAGQGAMIARADKELMELATRLGCPVTSTLLGKGVFPETHPLALGMLGMHGTYEANMTMQHCDVLIAVGARFDDRVIGNPKHFAQNPRKIIHIDIDPSSISKRVKVDVPIVGDVRECLAEFSAQVQAAFAAGTRVPKGVQAWWQQINEWRKKDCLKYDRANLEVIKPQFVVEKLWEVTHGDAFITSDVGQHQMWAAQFYRFDKPRRWINSGGLGTMGVGLPYAMGVQLANPGAQVACITGEGSIQMCIQELSTCKQYDLPVKVISLNNRYLGMVRQWQEIEYGSRYSSSYMEALPDFVRLAEAYGHVGIRVDRPQDVEQALRDAFGKYKDRTVFVDVITDQTENVWPMVQGGKGLTEMLLGSEDL
jgi:acetolactate synthase-1/2/3 large subunit